ncbi:MAG TPA: PASTA domain-containing protein [Actinomycetes bacterium]|nr:PASTA domain-containing protein [Actinomycetes bacterium]
MADPKVSSSDGVAQMPNVVGMQQRAAERVLEDAGLKANVRRREVTKGKDGEVLEQRPKDGAVVILVRDNGCTPGYSPCLLFAPGYDCPGRSADGPVFPDGVVRVRGDDPYGLDPDGDGYGCENS